MSATASDRLTDAHLRHAVDVARFERGIASRAKAEVSVMSPDLRGAVSAGLERILSRGPMATPWTRQAFVQLQERIDTITDKATTQLHNHLADKLRELARLEAKWTHNAAKNAGRELKPLDGRTVGTIVTEPIAGKTLSEWTDSMRNQLQARIKTELSQGLRNGEPNNLLMGRVGKAIEQAERNASAIASTATRHITAQVRQRMAEKNRDDIRGMMWVATLETTTCPTCWGRHGRVWKVGVGPRPPAHLGCACIPVPIFKGEPDPDVMDADDWLRTQSPEWQDEALGKERARMWRRGEIGSVRDLTNMRGRALTLKELEARSE